MGTFKRAFKDISLGSAVRKLMMKFSLTKEKAHNMLILVHLEKRLSTRHAENY